MLNLPRLDDDSVKKPYYIQLYEVIKKDITLGNIPANSKLPSIRKLAEQLNISSTPVELAFQQLLSEGYILSKPKRGYYVQTLSDSFIDFEKNKEHKGLIVYSHRDPEYFHYDFHISKNDFSLFPFRIWKKLLQESFANENLLHYGDPQGELSLREVLSNYLSQSRGLRCTAQQIVIGSDQYYLASILSLLMKSKHINIGFEDPGYHLFPTVFHKHKYTVNPIPLKEDGICIDRLYESPSTITYITPSHQFPRGMIMPIKKRMQLIEWAKTKNGYIIEDDYDGDFRYHGRPIPSLQGLIENSPVIYIGGFSQVLAPGFSIHYMVLPESLLSDYHQLKRDLYLEHSSSRIIQATLHRFIDEGHFAKHLRKIRQLYRKKHDQLLFSINTHFQERATVIGCDAGFHVILKISHHKTEAELVDIAKKVGIRITPASFSWWDQNQATLHEFMIGFGGIEQDKIDDAIKKLNEVWFP